MEQRLRPKFFGFWTHGFLGHIIYIVTSKLEFAICIAVVNHVKFCVV